ncbi:MULTISPECIES: hypothetical protein [Methylosinus]|uniref:Pectate lyase superfamily protein domain-containing protein n=1 Tax=Methylosinus trichosporium (strain ATCC 35070 / NCIMB 11131 / UNIQEM 75 / OB3b) TaxID=595536 RepID=A0A2D2CZI3_METT3|nr:MULTISPECIES: hypothetical protein [Methylosinus]ATQ68125.1 hypothetical protein CQW49_09695 [Methylosinus trichosporium OB3b]OBS53513.1 hypothetical protein A8B73_05510 [Methylosinus sp. 3S-1]
MGNETRRSSATSRRMILASAAVALASSCARSLAAPADRTINIIRAELTPYQFGARGDGSDDTAAFGRAVLEAARLERPLMIPRGDFVLTPPAASSWQFRNIPERTTHICVPLVSGLTVVGRGGRIMTRAPATPLGPLARIFLFGTGLNLSPGALRDILFDEVEFDFADEFSPIHSFTFAFGLTGVDNFEQRNLKLHSSGKRAGRGLFLLNGRDRRQIGCRHKNMIQGHYVHYEWGPIIRDVSFEHLTECMDWDGPAWKVDAKGLRFKNLVHEAQCIDSAGGSDWVISDVTAENTGSVFFLYHKLEAYPTFAEWFQSPEGSFTNRCVPMERILVRNVRGRAAGRDYALKAAETFRVGPNRFKKYPKEIVGVAPPKDITIEDVEIDGGFAAGVNECRNLQMRRVRLRNMDAHDDAERGAALYLHQATTTAQTLRESELSGVVSDVEITNSRGMGLLVDTPSDLTLRNLRIDGYNLNDGAHTRKGLEIRGLGRKSGLVELADVHVGGGAGAGLTDISVRGAAGVVRERLRMRGSVTGDTAGAQPLDLSEEGSAE